MAVNICGRCLALLKTVTVSVGVTGTPVQRSVAVMAKYLAAQSKQWNSMQESAAGIKPRYMATKVRSDEERKSRQASRVEKTAAHEKFPFLPTKATRQVYVLDKVLAGLLNYSYLTCIKVEKLKFNC